MPEEKKPKVGDKYAWLEHSLFGPIRNTVSGPWYVTSVRGNLVSLSRENKSDPKATRSWRIGPNGRLRSGNGYSGHYAEPWEDKHALAIHRHGLIVSMLELIDVHKKGGFEQLGDDTLRELVELLEGEDNAAEKG